MAGPLDLTRTLLLRALALYPELATLDVEARRNAWDAVLADDERRREWDDAARELPSR